MLDTISVLLNYGYDYFVFEDIYKILSNKYNLTPKYIKGAIQYSLDTRKSELAEKTLKRFLVMNITHILSLTKN